MTPRTGITGRNVDVRKANVPSTIDQNAGYAMTFNGTDEYLTRALPTDIAAFNPATTNGGWSITGAATINSNVTTELGSSNCIMINTTNVSGGISKSSFLTVGKKYKLKIRFKSTVGLKFGNTESSTRYFQVSATSQWNTIERTFTCVEDSTLRITSSVISAGTILIDTLTIIEDWKLDLNESFERIKHSINRDFEQTLGAEIASGTVTIGSKYVVTAGTVEGNAVGTEFLAVTNATTLDANNKVKEIPNLVTNWTLTDPVTEWTAGTGCTFTGGVAQVNNVTVASGTSFCSRNLGGFAVGKRLRLTFEIKNYSSGSLKINAGGNTQIVPNTNSNGIKTFDFVQSSNAQGYFGFYLSTGETFVGDIDNIHIYELPDYTSAGNHSYSYSTADKYAGTSSLKITATGAGTSGSNYVSLPYAQMETLVAGNKYTKEIFARLDPTSLTYGSTVILDGGFDDTSKWSIGSAWSISGSKATCDGSSNADGSGSLLQNISGLNGEILKITFDVLSADAGSILRIFDWQSLVFRDYNISSGSYVIYHGSRVGTNTLQLRNGVVGKSYTIDNISVSKATVIPTITSQIGTKLVTSATLNPNAWTKTVLNFEATASEVNQDLKLWLSGAGSVFVDAISLTQKYDIATAFSIQKNTDTSAEFNYSSNSTSPSPWQYAYWYDSSNSQKLAFSVNGTFSAYPVSLNLNTLYNVISVVNWTGNASAYIDNVLANSTAVTNTEANGKQIATQNLVLAKRTNSNSNYLNGLLGATQFIRFTNIGQSNFNPTTYKVGQSVSGGGAESVLLLDWGKDKTSMTSILKDWSNTGNNVTGVNVDQTNVVRKA